MEEDKHDIVPAMPREEQTYLEAEDKYDDKMGGEASVNVGAGLDHIPDSEEGSIKNDLQTFEEDIVDLEPKLAGMTLEHAHALAKELFLMHKHDQNFPQAALNALDDFNEGWEDIRANPGPHAKLIREVKIECLLATENSPYLEVRANTEPFDDPTLPCLTFRAFLIGTIFAGGGSFIDTLFSFRQPPVYVGTSVGQLLAYPMGKFLARVLPQRSFRMFGREVSLNPGPFNKKEHMLITIMCNVSMTSPYTTYIVPVQYLPQWFDQPWAHNFGYQILNTMGTTFVGYGFAGLTRRFLVRPSFAVWPGTLSNMALIKAFHAESNPRVPGPLGRFWSMSRERFFLYAFLAMGIYYFFPGFIFTALSSFSWISWIAPNNVKLDAITGMNGGMGINPWPSFDWNIAYSTGYVPLAIPLFVVTNMFVSVLLGTFLVLGIYFSNSWNTAYLPINSPGSWDNTGNSYDVTKILTNGRLDIAKYQAYSEPWMTAGTIGAYIFYFIMYSASVTYVVLFHRHEVAVAFRGFWKSVKRSFRRGNTEEEEEVLGEDIHCRLMRENYKDVPEWVYALVVVCFATLGMIGVGVYPSETSPVVLVYGVLMTLITIIPVGLIQAVTGLPVPTNVIAEFVGGSLVSGDANALMYFKTYGYISTYQAVNFSNDLKLGHYAKLPPWDTFTAQMWATLIYAVVSASIFNFAMAFKGVCTPEASFHFTCPGQTQFFTAAVFWGTLSPKRLFGDGKRYNMMLLGFPIGFVMVIAFWAAKKRWPRWALLRQMHPVMLCQGPIYYLAPYNLSYFLPWFYVTLFSFKYIKPRYTQFWAKYNYVLASAFPTGIAFSAVVIFFALEIPKGGLAINWWGNNIVIEGCEGQGGCPLLPIPARNYFGPAPGNYV